MSGSDPWDRAFGGQGDEDVWSILGGKPLNSEDLVKGDTVGFDSVAKGIEAVNRILTIQSEIELLQNDIKEVLREVEDFGIDANVIRDVLRRRKKTKQENEAHDIAVGNIEIRMDGEDDDRSEEDGRYDVL